MKYFLLIYALTVVAILSILGFRGDPSRKPPIEIFPDMDRQLKFLEQSENSLSSNGQSDRLPPLHSVPRGSALAIPAVFSTNSSDRSLGSITFRTGLGSSGIGLAGFPDEVKPTAALMRLGQERYDIYCSRCHGGLGNGKGPLSKFGLLPRNLSDPTEPDYLSSPIQRPVKQGDGSDRMVEHGYEGYVVHVIAEGYNTMLGLKDRINPRERWAIALYLRALQEWMKSKKVSEASIISKGKELFQAKICYTCHQVDPAVPAPAGVALGAPQFTGDFWGKEREVHIGLGGPVEKVIFNEEYFIESVRLPMAKVAKGALAPMPPIVPPPLTDQEINALMAYLRSFDKKQEVEK
ncbi:MAG: hypothetical protein CMI32_02535 [Opitutales bacterium]|jgi:mono/diheme cytochrome c family protein|nr:hypothetical protein [Opitutales bacterium]|tara:strand:- start:1791 stop:2840 length:1050 start_codon:yes stop_codon:yes gene_type:complete